MPDAGDEAGREAWNQSIDFLRWLAGASARALGTDVSLPNRARRAIERIRESESRTNVDDQLFDVDGTPCHEACAADRDEIEYLAAVLDANDVEYVVSPDAIDDPAADIDISSIEPDSDGLYRIWVPDREPAATIHAPFSSNDHILIGSREGYTLFSEAPQEVRDMVFDHSYSRATSKLGVLSACAEGAALPSAEAVAGRRDNAVIEFETVSWDRSGSILTEALNVRGVSFVSSRGKDSITLEIPRQHAAAALEVIEGLCAHVAGLSARRFAGISDLESKAKSQDVILTRTVQGRSACDATRAALDAEGVAYEFDYDGLADEGRFAISATQAASRDFKIPTSAERIREALGKSAARAAAVESAMREASPVKGFSEQAERIARETSRQKSTPAADEQRARKSARDQSRVLDRNKNQRRAR